ncbi:HPF/RaiA family ribosome-associated protein [Candidatus Peregrinibacteria bacterium]|nr:HPF/RaiA family ribosome-associated protein [Candidatus Peregrinibacteria bacterium]
METTFQYKNLNKKEEQIFLDYVSSKLEALEKMLAKFASDASLLTITVEKFDKHVAYQVEFYLTLPAKSLVAAETSHTINKAVDLSRDRLLAQLKKHLAQLRGDRAHRSVRRNKVGLIQHTEAHL